MYRISRREMLVASAILSKAGTGIAGEPSRDLTALIEAHKATYTDFINLIKTSRGTHVDRAACSRAEEKALLDICGFPVATDRDRQAKANYLLEIEARGELDLREHMRAVLLSMI